MNMKKIYFALTIALASFTLSPSSEASSVKDMTKKVLETLKKNKSKESFCKKADAFGSRGEKIYNVRSFNGALCNIKPIAYIAAKKCKGFPSQGKDDKGFDNSQCAKNIQKKFPKYLTKKTQLQELADFYDTLGKDEDPITREVSCMMSYEDFKNLQPKEMTRVEYEELGVVKSICSLYDTK